MIAKLFRAGVQVAAADEVGERVLSIFGDGNQAIGDIPRPRGVSPSPYLLLLGVMLSLLQEKKSFPVDSPFQRAVRIKLPLTLMRVDRTALAR
jgi:hypothetical protein